MRFLKSLMFIGSLTLWSFGGFAAEWTPYTATALKNAQDAGKTIVLDFHADWCTTCMKQKPILETALKKEEFKNVVGLIVNFDTEDALKKNLKIQTQSTLVVFKGQREVDRQLGITSKLEIEGLIRKGI